LFFNAATTGLIFAGTAESFDASDGDFGSATSLETKHRTTPHLYAATSLFDDVAEIFRGPPPGIFPKPLLLGNSRPRDVTGVSFDYTLIIPWRT
jgi:hypothetical protein